MSHDSMLGGIMINNFVYTHAECDGFDRLRQVEAEVERLRTATRKRARVKGTRRGPA